MQMHLSNNMIRSIYIYLFRLTVTVDPNADIRLRIKMCSEAVSHSIHSITPL